ncbi:MAG: DEAD/DEAH box helicase, partial [Aristaeellaceae bacterium]
EVYLSRDFRKMTPRKPMIRGQMRMRGGQLELQFTEDGQPAKEILGIMEALAKRRRYFRLKDGSFLDLSSMEDWQPLADSLYEAAGAEGLDAQTAGDVISLRAYRTCYLHSLLEAGNLPVTQDETVKTTVRALTDPSEETVQLAHGLSLRPYQQRGYEWLHTLDRLHMGGVLADDMGLGKTVQVIALLKASRKENETSLVVAPTSLTYNWLSELNRFAPELSVMVLNGSGAQRASQIRHVKEVRDIDVLITSYPLIRRDIDQLTDMTFRYVILDEAQHIKNAGSVGAMAVKQLQAQTRFALTGTPMENNAGELWSIFDFVLPGYLLSYNAFIRRYQDGQDADDLRRKIRPFLMRRLKKDVLTELPDKIETVLTAQMSPEQSKVYQSAMVRLRERVDHVMAEKGLGRGRTEVLAAITELRQICCHPALVLDDYTGTSGKLDMLLEILPGAIAAGRRVLLFSQFTSMLKILRRQLDAEGFETMYLDGETPSGKRLAMTEQFNGGQGQIFLISLKAGGTGLNLTGADMVIHYDPWWNPAAEDQATDRAHRIGQTRKVEVIRLVTHDSIEEQVVALGQRKKALFDQLVTPGETLVTALTEQDIRALFA